MSESYYVSVHLLTLFLGLARGCPESIELIRSGTICPGQVGFFQCTLTSLFQVGWNVNGEVSSFVPGDAVGARHTGHSTVAYLVDRVPVDGPNRFNWTSVLYYTPDPSISGRVNVTCSGGTSEDECTRTTFVMGKLLPMRVRACRV